MLPARNAIVALALSTALASPAAAATTTHNYTVRGLVEGGGVVSGSFSLTGDDFAHGGTAGLAFSNVNVSVTGGPASQYYGQMFSDCCFNNGRQFYEDNSSDVGATIEFISTIFAGGAELSLNFLYPGGGPIITTTPSRFDQSFYSNSGNANTYAVSGTVTPSGIAGAVPEPTQWLMLLGGFGIIGGVLRQGRARLGSIPQSS